MTPTDAYAELIRLYLPVAQAHAKLCEAHRFHDWAESPARDEAQALLTAREQELFSGMYRTLRQVHPEPAGRSQAP